MGYDPMFKAPNVNVQMPIKGSASLSRQGTGDVLVAPGSSGSSKLEPSGTSAYTLQPPQPAPSYTPLPQGMPPAYEPAMHRRATAPLPPSLHSPEMKREHEGYE